MKRFHVWRSHQPSHRWLIMDNEAEPGVDLLGNMTHCVGFSTFIELQAFLCNYKEE
jgi:hypothetical protein